jgi:hypothetical protein
MAPAPVVPPPWPSRQGETRSLFPLAEVAQAHRAGEQGHVRGKLVLLAG